MSNTIPVLKTRLEKNLEYRRKIAIQKAEEKKKLVEAYKRLIDTQYNSEEKSAAIPPVPTHLSP